MTFLEQKIKEKRKGQKANHMWTPFSVDTLFSLLTNQILNFIKHVRWSEFQAYVL
jgi:hypothetical protein